MLKGEGYEDFFKREKVQCCGRIPMPLPHIPVKITKGRGYDSHDSHYYNYAFECLQCGAVYEVVIENYSYESTGDFMQPNYTSWSVRPRLRYIEDHPILREKLVTIKKEWLGQDEQLDKLIGGLENKIDKKIAKLEQITGDLDEEQGYRTKQRLGKVEVNIIRGYKLQQDELRKCYLAKIRGIIGLPILDKAYSSKRIQEQFQIAELNRELESKQRELSTVESLISKTESKDKLVSEIAEIKRKMEVLNV